MNREMTFRETLMEEVQFIKLGNLIEENLGGGTPSKSVSEFWNGDIPWASVKDLVKSGQYIHQTQDSITEEGLKSSTSNLIPTNWLLVCTRINPGLCAITANPIAINQDIRALKLKKHVDIKYLWHFIKSLNLVGTGTTVKGISIEFLNNLLVPLPEINTQRRVAEKLDAFTILKAELEAELEARIKQYTYYRDYLLTFPVDSDRNVKWVTLADVIVSLKTGLNPRKNFSLNPMNAANYYVTVREIINGKVVFLEKTDRIDDEALRLINRRSNLEAGDVLFSGTGTIGRTAVIRDTPTNWGVKEGVYVIKPRKEKIIPQYLDHILNSGGVVERYSKKIVGSPVASLPMSDLRELVIPVPALEDQGRIVRVLDEFDSLTTDIKIGLPAEITARQKQYEYYRDKLLTFEEKAA